jgi:hypothetical protein
VGEHASPFIDSGPSNQYAVLSWKQVTLPLGHYEINTKKKKARQKVSKAEHGTTQYNEANRIWAQSSNLFYFVRRQCKGKYAPTCLQKGFEEGRGFSSSSTTLICLLLNISLYTTQFSSTYRKGYKGLD